MWGGTVFWSRVPEKEWESRLAVRPVVDLAHGGDEIVQAERFQKNPVVDQLHEAARLAVIHRAGDENDPRAESGTATGDLPEQRHTVGIGQDDIEDDPAIVAEKNERQRILAARRDVHFVILTTEGFHHQREDGFVVVYGQNPVSLIGNEITAYAIHRSCNESALTNRYACHYLQGRARKPATQGVSGE